MPTKITIKRRRQRRNKKKRKTLRRKNLIGGTGIDTAGVGFKPASDEEASRISDSQDISGMINAYKNAWFHTNKDFDEIITAIGKKQNRELEILKKKT